MFPGGGEGAAGGVAGVQLCQLVLGQLDKEEGEAGGGGDGGTLEGGVWECNGDWEGGGGCPLPGLVEEEGSDLKGSDMTGYYQFADLDKLEAE